MTKAQVEVITSVQRRRHRSRADKQRIVAAAMEPAGSSPPLALLQRFNQRRYRRSIDWPGNPHPAATGKLDLYNANLLYRRRRDRFRLWRNRDRIENRWNLRWFAELPAPTE